jgi:hypothetical protein
VWGALEGPKDGDRRAIANAFIGAQRARLVRNSGMGVYLRGAQAHRGGLRCGLPTSAVALPADSDASNVGRGALHDPAVAAHGRAGYPAAE